MRAEDDGELFDVEEIDDRAAAALFAAREQVTALVARHPAATLAAAFALGYAVARLARHFGGGRR
jgi:hypothetical protein